MKMGLLFRHCFNQSPMEGETSKLKAYQEGRMDAPSEKVFMQKMLECVETQADVLKKILGHLSEIEKKEPKKHKTKHESSGLTQEGIDLIMAEGKVHLPPPNFKPQLRGASRP